MGEPLVHARRRAAARQLPPRRVVVVDVVEDRIPASRPRRVEKCRGLVRLRGRVEVGIGAAGDIDRR